MVARKNKLKQANAFTTKLPHWLSLCLSQNEQRPKLMDVVWTPMFMCMSIASFSILHPQEQRIRTILWISLAFTDLGRVNHVLVLTPAINTLVL